MEQRFAIFDMDGTLVDSMMYWHNLGREYLISKGVKGDLNEVLERTKPMTMIESGALFIREFGLDGTPESVAAEINAVMEDHYRNDVELKDGARDYLEQLRRSGVRMCVASATPENLVDLCLTRLGVREYFEFLLSCEAVGSGKTRPDVYLAAAERLGGAIENTVIYEDAWYAVRTARAAGFRVVAIYDNNSKARWDEIRELADTPIESWSELLEA